MKALRSLDTGKRISSEVIEPRRLTQRLVTPQPERLNYVRYAFEQWNVSPRSRPHDTRHGSHGSFTRFKRSNCEAPSKSWARILSSIPSRPSNVLRKAKRMGMSPTRALPRRCGAWMGPTKAGRVR